MSFNQLKPRKNSRYSQGYIDPRSCKKLINNSEPVVYRSSYERTFVVWCETSSQVVRWGSECICIPYLLPDGSRHKYYPDYYVEMRDGSKYVIEVKPSNQTKAPVNENSWAHREWVKNNCKWRAAQEYCQAKGFQFKILTERTIKQLA
jgi:hypothetical protein